MKIQCNVCEAAEATVLCCADEAALCWCCDEKVHAANKLASKHQRVPLSSSSSPMPNCDICQETVGYFFCLEDRALLCRKCDVAIHTANSNVSAHQRFLLTGVKVGLEPIDLGALSSSGNANSGNKISEVESRPMPLKSVPTSLSVQCNRILPASVNADTTPPKYSFTGGTSSEGTQQWQLDEFLGLPELDQNYGYMENGSSKVDSGKLGESDCSPILRSLEVELDCEDRLGLVPDASWAVPEIPSPPTASGMSWPTNIDHYMDMPAFVPDVCYSPMLNLYHRSYQINGGDLKRRRQY